MLNVVIQLQNVVIQLLNVVIQLLNVVIQLLNVVIQLLNVVIHLQNVVIQLQMVYFSNHNLTFIGHTLVNRNLSTKPDKNSSQHKEIRYFKDSPIIFRGFFRIYLILWTFLQLIIIFPQFNTFYKREKVLE